MQKNGAHQICETSDDASYVSPPSPKSSENVFKKAGLRHEIKATTRKLSIIPENDEQEE